jgi:hypothetical protein
MLLGRFFVLQPHDG